MSNELAEELGADVSPEEVEDTAETEVEAANEAEAENEADSPPADKETVEEKPEKGLQARIDKLTQRFREAERTALAKEQELAELRKQLEERPEPEEPVKSLADFDYDNEKYLEYRLGLAEKRAERAAERVAKQARQESQKSQAESEFKRRESEFAKEHPDYTETVYADSLRISPPMAREIQDSELGPEVAYYLAKHPDEASEIAELPDRGVIRRIARLEDQLRAEKSKATPKKVSEAPPPPSKLKGEQPGLKISTTDPASDKLSDAEWFRREEARNAKLMKR